MTSKLEETLAFQIRVAGLPRPEREYRFHSRRRWRFDFAYPHTVPPIAIEVEGGIWKNGRHQRPKGFEQDCYKYNVAALSGWCVLRFTEAMIGNGQAITMISKALEGGDAE